MEKKNYFTPTVTVEEVRVEKGFAGSIEQGAVLNSFAEEEEEAW